MHCEDEAECSFTTAFDIAESVIVVMQVAVEDETHGELCKDKTQLRTENEKTGARVLVSSDVAKPSCLSSTNSEQMATLVPTHMEDDVEDRLEDDDVFVARSLRKLLLLMYMLFLIVDILVVLLRHPK